MSSKGIKIAAWISIGINVLAVLAMLGDLEAPDTGYGLVYAIGMAIVSVVTLIGSHEWDRQTETAATLERNLRERLRNAPRKAI